MAHDDLAARLGVALDALPPGALVVGFSGGLDSTVLLHALANMPAARERGLRAVHVDHGLHADSPTWAEHALAVADAFGVAARAIRIDIYTMRNAGREAAARSARHAAFARELRSGEWLALAHHADDQAETLLLKLLRGGGTAALGSMRTTATRDGLRLWRPLLDLPRAALEHHAKRHGLTWLDDPSNADRSLDRNFIRHEILGALRTRWPQAATTLARSARLLAEDAARLDRVDAQALAMLRGVDPRTLALDGFRRLDGVARRAVLRRWLRELGWPTPPADVIDGGLDAFLAARDDGDACLAWRGVELRIHGGLLHALAPAATENGNDGDRECAWDGRAPLALAHGMGTLSLEPVPPDALDWTVRPRRGGERILLPGREHGTSLKHVLQDLGVPPWTRRRVPLVFAGDTLLAAGDLALSATLHAWLRARGMRLLWTPGDATTRGA